MNKEEIEEVLEWLRSEGSVGLDLSPGEPRARKAAEIIETLQKRVKTLEESVSHMMWRLDSNRQGGC